MAIIILNCEILSLFQTFSEKNIILLSITSFLISFICWFKSKQKFYILNFPNKIKLALKSDKSLLIFFIFFCFMLFTTGFLAIFSLPLEADSRMYHFSRIFEYINQHSFLHFDTNEIRNTLMPINSEMIYSYFYILKKNEFSFGLLSHFSFIWLVLGLYGIFKELKFPTKTTLFSIFTFSSFGLIIAQIPFLQTDLLISSLSILSLYLFIKNKFFFSSLSYALALGIKTTALINFIPFLILLLSYNLIYKKNLKNILKFLSFLSFNFIIFSSYNYFLNFLDFKNFLTNKALYAEHYFDFNKVNIIFNFKNLISDLFYNKNLLFFDERRIGLSFQGIFIFIPCLMYSFLNFINSKNEKRFFISICSFIFILNFLIYCFNFTYSEYIIRYFAGVFAFSIFCFSYGYYKKFSKIIITFLSCLNLFIFPFLIFKFPINTFFELKNYNLSSLKEIIILKKQKDINPYIQYKFLQIFKNNFSKDDKIAILNNNIFYEIKQLKNLDYKIDTITLNNLINNDLSNYNYIFLSDYTQTTNNLNSIDDFIKNDKNLNCKNYTKYIKNELFPLSQECAFNKNLLIKKGFELEKIFTEQHKKMIIYKNTKNHI